MSLSQLLNELAAKRIEQLPLNVKILLNIGNDEAYMQMKLLLRTTLLTAALSEVDPSISAIIEEKIKEVAGRILK